MRIINRKEKLKFYPSLASGNPLNLKCEVDRLADFPNLHLDIEDGNFIPNITFGIKTVSRVAEYVGSSRDLDVHLFVNDPQLIIEQLVSLKTRNIKKIAVHIEALRYPLETLQYIRSHGIEAGVGLNFITPAEIIIPFVDRIDYVVVMTSEPDGQGDLFNPNMLHKIIKVTEIMQDENQVWVDGGINADNIKSVVDAGASNIVLGRAIYADECPRAIVENLHKICFNA